MVLRALELLLLMELRSVLLIMSNHLPMVQNGVWEVRIFLILGTCVNVGCIPKKLFHHIAQLGEIRTDMNEAGWSVDKNVGHQW